LCCEIFVTKSKLKASLAVWRNLLPYIFQGGLKPGSPSRRAAPACKYNKQKYLNYRNFSKAFLCNIKKLETSNQDRFNAVQVMFAIASNE